MQPDNADELKPHIVCALEADTIVFPTADQNIDMYRFCEDHHTSTVIYYPETDSIFICKSFFRLPAQPYAGHCPTFNKNTNQFDGSYAAFWVMSQMYSLLYELANFYLGLPLAERGNQTTNQTWDWDYAFSLSPRNSTLNALNYILYVASKSKLILNRYQGKIPFTLALTVAIQPLTMVAGTFHQQQIPHSTLEAACSERCWIF